MSYFELLKRPSSDGALVHGCSVFCEARRRDNCLLTYEPAGVNVGVVADERVWVAFLGLPGAGKTTQVKYFSSVLGDVSVFHMGSFMKSHDAAWRASADGSLVDGFDDAFLSAVKNCSSRFVLLDGFPRTLQQLELVVAASKEVNVRLKFVVFDLSRVVDAGDVPRALVDSVVDPVVMRSVRFSYFRQLQRDRRSGKPENHGQYVGKIVRALNHDLRVVSALEGAGYDVCFVDVSESDGVISDGIRAFLGVGFGGLGWQFDVLREMERASVLSGIEAWASSGSVYRAFWNGAFGPMQDSVDIDVIVDSVNDVDAFMGVLEGINPNRRWSVFSWRQHGKRHYDFLGDETLADWVAARVLTYRQGVVRLVGDDLVVLLTRGAESDLRSGKVRLDEGALKRLSVENRDYHLSKSVGTLPKLLDEYPGVTLVGELVGLFENHFSYHHSAVRVPSSWLAIERLVMEAESGGRPEWDVSGWGKEEIRVANLVVRHYLTADRRESSPPVPVKSVLPSVLRDVSDASDGVIVVPSGYGSWFHYVASVCCDAEFREWLINQTRSRNPVGGRDSEVVRVLSLDAFRSDGRVRNAVGEQKATHSGWKLHMHLRQSMLQLRTDDVVESLNGVDPSVLRLALRLALLYHDVGKLFDVHTPGVHEKAGAYLFYRHKPSWVSDDVAKLTGFLITNHDLFGRLARGITEKVDYGLGDVGFDVRLEPSYRGALDPRRVRVRFRSFDVVGGLTHEGLLRMVKAVWSADVSSVSSLRWLLPVADLLHELVLIDF